MQAIIYERYGPPDVLQLVELEKPTPKEHQVLVKVHAASINAADYRPRKPDPALARLGGGLLRPKDGRIGSDVAGRVEAVGETVERFRPGDEVFGCAHGALAEYALAKEAYLVHKPAAVSFEQAASAPIGGLTALQGLRDAAGIQPGQKVLIQGGSGSVGSFSVQLAKYFGAQVTAVISTRNVELARSWGADHVIDYARDDFTRKPERYDLIFAINGYHSLRAYKRALTPQGLYLCAGGTMPQIIEAILLGPLMSRKGGKQLRMMAIAKVVQADLELLGELLVADKLVPFIDRTYPLSETVEAFRYVEKTHPHGKVVVTVAQGE